MDKAPSKMPVNISTSARRDDPINNSRTMRKDLARASINDDTKEHTCNMLDSLYSPEIIDYSAVPGFEDTAARFASQVLFNSPIISYLDLGVGTGLTARLLVDAGHDFRLLVAEGLPAFLTQAFDKLKSEFPGRRWGGEPVATLKSDVFTDMVRLGKRLLEKHGLSGVSLITAQRVFLNLRKDRRAEQLRRWASLLSPGGRLIVGVPHPRRRVAAFMIGRSPSTCRVIVGSATRDRCRSYARSLADQAGLRIVNDMPPHLSTSIEEARICLVGGGLQS